MLEIIEVFPVSTFILSTRGNVRSMCAVRAALNERVTDKGICALAKAGCGAHLTSLALLGL